MSDRSIINGNVPPGAPYVFSGAVASALTWNSPTWQAGQFSYVKIHIDLAAVNLGALGLLLGQFQGPPAASYKVNGQWGAGATATSIFTVTSVGTPGGSRGLIAEDQLNVAAPRSIDVEVFPNGKYFTSIVNAFDPGGTGVSISRFSNYTTSATAITGWTLDGNGATLPTGTFNMWAYV